MFEFCNFKSVVIFSGVMILAMLFKYHSDIKEAIVIFENI